VRLPCDAEKFQPLADTLSVLESYLTDVFEGVLLLVSHDRYFVDIVADRLFVFQGEGEVEEYLGSLTDYAAAVAKTVEGNSGKHSKEDYKERKARRTQKKNDLRKKKNQMNQLEKKMDERGARAEKLRVEIENTPAEEGWTVLAELTSNVDLLQSEIDDMEIQWLELAEQIELEEEDEE